MVDTDTAGSTNTANRLKADRFPVTEREDFYVAASAIPPATSRYLTNLGWMSAQANTALVEPRGTGTWPTLNVGGHAAAPAGRKVTFCTAADRVEQLHRGLVDTSIGKTRRPTLAIASRRPCDQHLPSTAADQFSRTGWRGVSTPRLGPCAVGREPLADAHRPRSAGNQRITSQGCGRHYSALCVAIIRPSARCGAGFRRNRWCP